MLIVEDYCTINKGIKKDINQDNAFINGIYLPEQNDGLSNYQKKRIQLKNKLTYAVFDGVGGLDKGEHASFLAATTLNSLCDKEDINRIIEIINTALCDEKKMLNTDLGSTATIVRLDRKNINISQVGDSAVYISSKNEFKELNQSDDSTNLLGDYLGNKEEVKINNLKYKLRSDTKIILCSDGLTKIVDKTFIRNVLETSNDVIYITNKLLNEALKQGGTDNISIITLYIKRNYSYWIFIIVLMFIIGLIILGVFY